MKSSPYSTKLLEESDAVVIITDHSAFDAKEIATHSQLVVDTRNFIAKNDATEVAGDKLFKL